MTQRYVDYDHYGVSERAPVRPTALQGVGGIVVCGEPSWWQTVWHGKRQHCDHWTGEHRWWPQHGLVEHYAPVIECCRCHRQVKGYFWNYNGKHIRRIGETKRARPLKRDTGELTSRKHGDRL